MFSGHLDQLSLSSASLASSFASVTGNSLLVCSSAAQPTLVCMYWSLPESNIYIRHAHTYMAVCMFLSYMYASEHMCRGGCIYMCAFVCVNECIHQYMNE
jgi:hypothetical protein